MSLRYASSYITVPDKDRRGDNRRPRDTEISALQRLAFGEEIPATDAQGEALRKGEYRCPRCNQSKEEKCFAVWVNKKTNKKYRKRLCNACRNAIQKAKHYSEIEGYTTDDVVIQLYPARMD